MQFRGTARGKTRNTTWRTWDEKLDHLEWLLSLAKGKLPVLALMPPMGTDWHRALASATGAIGASVTRDGLPQIDVEEAAQGAPDRGAIGAFRWLKPTLADERLKFAVAQLNGHAYELGGASMASEALTFGGRKTRQSA